MARQITGGTKVVRTAHDAGAENPLPDAVHHHSRREGIVARSDPLRHLQATARVCGDRRCARAHRRLDESAWHGRTKIADAAADVNLGVFRHIVLGDAHCLGTWREVFLQNLEFLFEHRELLLEPLRCGGFLLGDHLLGIVLGRQKLDGIDRHIALRPCIGDEHETLAIALEPVGTHGCKLQPREIGRGEFEILQFLAVGMQDVDHGSIGTVGPRIEGHAHFVASRLRHLRRKRYRLLPFAFVKVMNVAAADERAAELRLLPLADLLRFAVIHHKAGQFRWRDRFPLPQIGAVCVPQVVFEAGDLPFKLVGPALMGLHFPLRLAIQRQWRIDPVSDVVGVVAQRFRAAEDARHGVVVAGGDGVEFVIMAAGAADGHAEEGAAQCVELLIDDVHAQHALVLLLVVRGAEHEETGGSHLTAALRCIFKRQHISGDLLADHAVDGRIVADGFEDVVPEAPRILEGQRAPAAGGFGKAGHVQPVGGEALGESGCGQHRIHECFVIAVRQFRRARWQAGEIKGQAPQERARPGRRCGLQAVRFEFRQNEAVDGIGWPRLVLHLGRREGLRRLEGPEARIRTRRLRRPLPCHHFLTRIRSARFDPQLQIRDLAALQLPLRRHL